MSKTKRRTPISKEKQRERLEREWERQAVEYAHIVDPTPEVGEELALQGYTPQYTPGAEYIQKVQAEAQAIVDARMGQTDKATRRMPYSVQSPADDAAVEGVGSFIWWTGGQLDSYIPLSEYGSPSRAMELRVFALSAPLILLAISALTKKTQALQWTVEGGRNLAQKWQKRINNFENGDGWDYFIARWVRSLCESDGPSCAELIRSAPSWAVDDSGRLTPRGQKAVERGEDRVWEIVDARVMDPVNVFPTRSTEFPIIYHNSYTGQRHKMRPYQFMTLIDMPSVDDRFPLGGTCAVSRAVWAAREDQMIIRYCMEKMSENPGAGIVMANVNAKLLETALDSAKGQREGRGVVYYKGIIFLPILNPAGTTRLEFLNFAGLPDGFDRASVYNILKEITATAFGLDILELGSIPGRMGTATQAKVAAAKGRTKTLGAIMQGVERQFKYKLLPESVSFSIKKHDQDEELMRAMIDEIYFNNAIRFSQFTDAMVATQYLVDKGAVPNEYPYRAQDLTPSEEVTDVGETIEGAPLGHAPDVAQGPEGAATEIAARSHDPRVRVDRNGNVVWMEAAYRIKQLALPDLSPTRARTRFERTHPEYAGLL